MKMRSTRLACLALTALLLASSLTGCSAREMRDRVLLYLFSAFGQSSSASSEISQAAAPEAIPEEEPTPTPTPTPHPITRTVEDANAEISSLLSDLSSLESSMTSEIDSYASSARSEYHALPAKEQTYLNKVRIIMSYAGTLSSLESSCDAQVNTIVAKIYSALEDSGQSTALADQVRSSYESKKSSAISSLRSSAGI